jgi:hypothetical protein
MLKLSMVLFARVQRINFTPKFNKNVEKHVRKDRFEKKKKTQREKIKKNQTTYNTLREKIRNLTK